MTSHVIVCSVFWRSLGPHGKAGLRAMKTVRAARAEWPLSVRSSDLDREHGMIEMRRSALPALPRNGTESSTEKLRFAAKENDVKNRGRIFPYIELIHISWHTPRGINEWG